VICYEMEVGGWHTPFEIGLNFRVAHPSPFTLFVKGAGFFSSAFDYDRADQCGAVWNLFSCNFACNDSVLGQLPRA
jgi:hypothetical protein